LDQQTSAVFEPKLMPPWNFSEQEAAEKHMASSNLWVELAATYLRTRAAHQDHETAKAELKMLVPGDANEAIGHGLRAKRSRSGAISFDPIHQLRSYSNGERQCTSRVSALARSQRRWRKPKPSRPTRRKP
jgi:hypothetical protein